MLRRKWGYKDINLLFFFALLPLIGINKISDPDFFWHIKIGEWIIKNKCVPVYDIFSYASRQSKLLYYAHEWLFDTVLYSLYKFLGYSGANLYIYIISLINLLMMYKIVYLKTNKVITASIAAFIYFPLMRLFLSPRSMSIYLAVFLILIYLLELYIMKDKNYLWLLPVLTVLLINFHGGSISMFFVIIFAYLILGSINISIGKLYMDKFPNHKLKTILFYTLLCIPALLINPYGINILKFGFTIMNTQNLKAITEWKSIFSFKLGMTVCINMLLPYLIFAITREKIRILDLAFVMGSSILAASSVRHIILFAIFNCAYMGIYINDIIMILKEKIENHKLSKVIFDYFSQINEKFTNTVCIKSFLGKSILLIIVGAFLIVPFNMLSGINEKAYPYKAVQYIKENKIDVNKNIMLNYYTWGGYLIFNDIPVFIDGRQDLYLKEQNKGVNIYNDYLSIATLQKNWADLLNSYKVKYILFPNNESLINVLKTSDKWKKLYEDDISSLYERVD